MRRLPLLTSSAVLPTLSLALSSTTQTCSPSLSHTGKRATQAAQHTLRFSRACMSTAAAPLRSSAAPTSLFTSFEMESELMWAQEDAREAEEEPQKNKHRELVTPPPMRSRTLNSPTISPASVPSFSPTVSVHRVSAEKDLSARTPKRPAALVARARLPPAAALSLTLPSLLRRPRWRGGAEARRGESEEGYLDAAASALKALQDDWRHRRSSEKTSFFAAEAQSSLRHAHADALLAMTELLLSPSAFACEAEDAAAGGGSSAFAAALLPCLLRLLCRRHVELTGRHVAHLSRLLLAHPPLFRGAFLSTTEQHQQCVAVWDAFTLVCYATRRHLRRKHNRDCLEAFLWGVYAPLQSAHQPQQQQQQHRASGGRVDAPSVDAELWAAARKSGVRRAVLHHLLHRCLETETAAEIGVQAAAHVDLLLAWALLLAWEEVEAVVRDAVIHRLCKQTRLEGHSRRPAHGASGASVEQWKRLALRLAAAHTKADGDRGTAGRAAQPGARVFAAMDRESRYTSGWSIVPLDRQLLRCVLSRPSPSSDHQAPADASMPTTLGVAETSRHFGAVRPAQLAADDDALRLREAARTTLHAYAQMRWGRLESAAPMRASAGLASCEEEMGELIHTALELPKHAWCLCEAVAVRLVRCVRHYAALLERTAVAQGKCVMPPPQLLAAFRRMARHSRTDVVTTAVVMEETEGCRTRAGGEAACDTTAESRNKDAPFSAAFTTAAIADASRQLTCAAEAEWVAEVWAHDRSMAVGPIPHVVLARLHAWVKALSPSLRSEEFAIAVAAMAQIDTAASQLSGAVAPVDEAWQNIVRDAQPTAVAPQSTVPEMHPTLATPPVSRVQHSTLLWTHLVNANPRREWQLSAMSRPLASTAAAPTAKCPLIEWSPVVGAVVESTEKDGAAQVEEACLHRLFNAHIGSSARSWAVRRDWHWLDHVSAAVAHSQEHPAPSSGEWDTTPSSSLSQQTRILRAYASPSRTVDGGAVECAWVPPKLTLATSAEAAAAAADPDTLLLFLDWDAALHTLSSYAARTTDTEQLSFLVGAFTRCFVGLWATFRCVDSLPTSLEPPHDAIQIAAALMPHYATALRLCSELREARGGAAASGIGGEAKAAVLPDALHLNLFRSLLHAAEPQWQQCEALICLAGSATSASPSPSSAQKVCGACVLPDRVLAEVIAAYAAAQRPLPLQLRQWCEGA